MITPKELTLDVDNPPTQSNIWERFRSLPTTYELVTKSRNKFVYSIKVSDTERYLLLSRILPENLHINQIYSCFLEEIEMLKVFHKKGMFVPKLDDAETSEEASFWRGSTFYVDLLFQIEGGDIEFRTLSDQVGHLSNQPKALPEDFQKLSDLAMVQQQFLNLNFNPGYMAPETCIAKVLPTAGEHMNESMYVESDNPNDSQLGSPIRRLVRKEWDLVLLSSGILDRELEKKESSNEEITKINQRQIMTYFCQLAAGDAEPRKLEEYNNKPDDMTNKFQPSNPEGYKTHLTEILGEYVYEKPEVRPYTRIEEFMRTYMETQSKETEMKLTTDDVQNNLFAKGQAPGENPVKTNLAAKSCLFTYRFLLIALILMAIAGFIIYPLVNIGSSQGEKEAQASLNSGIGGILGIKNKLGGGNTTESNGTNSLEEQVKSLSEQVEQLIKQYNDVNGKLAANTKGLAEKEAQLIAAGNLIAAKEEEFVKSKADWEAKVKEQEGKMDDLKKENTTLIERANQIKATNDGLASGNSKLKDEIQKKDGLIQNAAVSFYQSMLDVADMSKLAQTIYRVYQLESVTDVVLTRDGGFLLTGCDFEENTVARMEATLVKVNSMGQEEWRRVFNYAGSDHVFSAQETPNGDFVLAGNILPGYYAFNDDLWVARVNSKGEDVWHYTYPYSEDGAHGVLYTKDDHIIVVGAISNYTSDSTRPWIVKMNNKKEIIWDIETQWIKNDAAGINFQSYDARSVIEASDGDYVVVGFLEGYTWIIKISPAGEVRWNVKSIVSGFGLDLREAPDGGFVTVSSKTNAMISGSESRIAKFNNKGELQWQRIFVDEAGLFQYSLTTMDILPDGFIFGGEIGYWDQYYWYVNANWLLKTDFEGQKVWDRQFGAGRISRVKTTKDGAIVATQIEYGVSSMFKFYPKPQA